MDIKQKATDILNELSDQLALVDNDGIVKFAEIIAASPRIYLTGTGRSGVAIRGFTNRLMHLGLDVHMIGEITVPHSRPGDLLVIGSGSGETPPLVATAKKAKSAGLKIALNTIDPNSTIAGMADVIMVLPGSSPKVAENMRVQSIQPMASCFEQLSLILYDAVILALMEMLGQDKDMMFARHADLE